MPNWAALVLCAFGGVAAWVMPPVACLLVGFGALAAGAGRSGGHKVLLAVATLVAATAPAVLYGSVGLPGALVPCALALGLALAAEKGAWTPGTLCVAAVLCFAAQVGLAELDAAARGTTLSASFVGLLSDNRQLLQVAGLDTGDWSLVEWAVGLFWPAAYATIAAIQTACAGAGVAIAAARVRPTEVKLPSFAEFDLPLWVTAIFVAALAGLAVDLTVPAASSDALLCASGNLLVAARCAFAAQGFAVLAWRLRNRKVSGVACAVAFVAAAILEAQFIVMAIVGLVDVWADFRRLRRGEGTDGH